jgi:hypothetical protein
MRPRNRRKDSRKKERGDNEKKKESRGGARAE